MRGAPFTSGSSAVLNNPSGPGSRRVIWRFHTEYGRPGVMFVCAEKLLLFTKRKRTPRSCTTSRSYESEISCSTGALTPRCFGVVAGRVDDDGSAVTSGHVV